MAARCSLTSASWAASRTWPTASTTRAVASGRASARLRHQARETIGVPGRPARFRDHLVCRARCAVLEQGADARVRAPAHRQLPLVGQAVGYRAHAGRYLHQEQAAGTPPAWPSWPPPRSRTAGRQPRPLCLPALGRRVTRSSGEHPGQRANAPVAEPGADDVAGRFGRASPAAGAAGAGAARPGPSRWRATRPASVTRNVIRRWAGSRDRSHASRGIWHAADAAEFRAERVQQVRRAARPAGRPRRGPCPARARTARRSCLGRDLMSSVTSSSGGRAPASQARRR